MTNEPPAEESGPRKRKPNIYTLSEIARIEAATGLVHAGNLAADEWAVTPIFMRADRSPEDMRARVLLLNR